MVLGQLPGPLADRRGEQQLAARRGPQAVGGVQAALVGDPEVADLLDAVAPELHPQRVFLGGREHVQDAAAHGDLAAVLDQVGAHVADVHQPGDGLLEVGVLAWAQRHRFQVAQPADHRLQQAAHRADQHGDRAGLRAARVRVGQPAQHGQPPPGGVRARRDPFVRQGFPGREAGHRAWRQQRLEGAGQFLRLARRGRHGQHEALRFRPGLIRPGWGGGQCRGQEWPQRGRCDEIRIRVTLAQRMPQPGVLGYDAEQSGEAHGVLDQPVVAATGGSTKGPH